LNGGAVSNDIGIIEIGPGVGCLTKELCKRAKKVVAIELDKRLIPVLDETMAEFDNFKLISGDILKTDINSVIEDEFQGMEVCVCSNLPYYITTPVIMYLLESQVNVKSITMMMQKEVADRITANPLSGNYGAITLTVNYFSDTKNLFKVTSDCFMPPPKIESSVVRFDVRKKYNLTKEHEKFMFKLIRAAFNQRRKTLTNALTAGGAGMSKIQIEEILTDMNISKEIRGEKLSIEEYIALAERCIKCRQ